MTSSNPANFTVNVDVIETLGWESHVHFRLGEAPFLAVLEAQKVAHFVEDQKVGLYISPSVVHLFNNDEHGTAIAHGKQDEKEAKAIIDSAKNSEE